MTNRIKQHNLRLTPTTTTLTRRHHALPTKLLHSLTVRLRRFNQRHHRRHLTLNDRLISLNPRSTRLTLAHPRRSTRLVLSNNLKHHHLTRRPLNNLRPLRHIRLRFFRIISTTSRIISLLRRHLRQLQIKRHTQLNTLPITHRPLTRKSRINLNLNLINLRIKRLHTNPSSLLNNPTPSNLRPNHLHNLKRNTPPILRLNRHNISNLRIRRPTLIFKDYLRKQPSSLAYLTQCHEPQAPATTTLSNPLLQ